MIYERISDDIPPPQMKMLNMVIPNLMHFCSFKLECCKRHKVARHPHKVACHPTKGDVINDVKLFLTVYRSIYCRKFLMLFNATLRYKLKCIRI